MDEVQKHNSFNINTSSSESYKNYSQHVYIIVVYFVIDSVRKLLDMPSYLITQRNQRRIYSESIPEALLKSVSNIMT
jgi:hypothetical protein